MVQAFPLHWPWVCLDPHASEHQWGDGNRAQLLCRRYLNSTRPKEIPLPWERNMVNAARVPWAKASRMGTSQRTVNGDIQPQRSSRAKSARRSGLNGTHCFYDEVFRMRCSFYKESGNLNVNLEDPSRKWEKRDDIKRSIGRLEPSWGWHP